MHPGTRGNGRAVLCLYSREQAKRDAVCWRKARANMQLAFEFAQRLATIRSPVEILSVIAEFTSKRIAMFQKYSVEIAALSTVVVSPTSKMDWTFISLKRSETGVGHPS